ncbi:MAG: choice-of-anchor I family protein [Lachnospiraceae bacterium]|nr:choice-of-anchor I family protein [Lachnospiraceae bacterium]
MKKKTVSFMCAAAMLAGLMGNASVAHAAENFKAVSTTDTVYEGFYNDTSSLKMTLSARFNSGAMNEDGGSSEIITYNEKYNMAYVVNGTKGVLDCVPISQKTSSANTVKELSGTELNVKELVESKDDSFTYGDMTSVSVSPNGKMIVVAVQDDDYSKSGRAIFFTYNKKKELVYKGMSVTGVQPDMITFVNNSKVLTADEGEPRKGVNGVDPKGSVSIIDATKVSAKKTQKAKIAYFDSFDVKREKLIKSGVIIQKDTMPSTDFEPEYIAVSSNGKKAYVALQEANSIATLDLRSGKFTKVSSLGLQNYNETEIDLLKNDEIELANYDVYGIKMPDGISIYEKGGKTYLLTANEGDSRADWDGLDNEVESKTSPSGNLKLSEKVVWFNADMFDGLDAEKNYVFGGRSFSMYEVTSRGLKLVFDSGSDFESITAECLPDNFNCSNDKVSLDNRSGKKGPEAESVVIGKVKNHTYAFVALERISGVMVYDITNPKNVKFTNYINSRDFSSKIKDDVSPEGLKFVSGNGKTAKLLASCEVSGTVAVYDLKAGK